MVVQSNDEAKRIVGLARQEREVAGKHCRWEHGALALRDVNRGDPRSSMLGRRGEGGRRGIWLG